MSRALAVASVLLTGCGAVSPSRIVRRVGGEVRAGAFVAPLQYEHFIRAELALAHDRPAEAVEHLRLVRAGGDDDPLPCARMAEALESAGDPAAADATLGECLALDPTSEAVWMAIGRIAQRRGRFSRALEAYGRAMRTAPDSREPVMALVTLLDAMGARTRADALRRAFERRTGAPFPEPRARAAERLLARDRPSAALRVLGSGAPTDQPEALRARARAWLALGAPDHAEPLIVALPDDAFENAVAHVQTLVRIGRIDLAIERARAAVARDDVPMHRAALGLALLAAGRNDESADWLASVPSGSSPWPIARAALLDALRAGGMDAVADEVDAHAPRR
ncbi:MAG: hypothetical protein NZ898_02150 [Myxococcota bacterium]|nr:hypothetical protein [Myxococcota bacterium]MDW8361611.1 hypothetical protein [Myxococcales bacterium]